ncbi:MAG: secondary thiamine-phosphate synthase enzyme YjbQ [Desulfobulbaceae bacterium]|nr:secondary thiamine-phosphate synthase enzyme YjbQ [Desulfobulbaceae bacterium]
MDILSGSFSLTTSGRIELIDITAKVEKSLKENTCPDGLLYLFNPHTTAGLTINEGADPAVRQDICDGLQALVPADYPFRHAEGNSPAHIMATLCGSSLTIAMSEGRLVLGRWQRIFFSEFDGPRQRFVHWRLLS